MEHKRDKNGVEKSISWYAKRVKHNLLFFQMQINFQLYLLFFSLSHLTTFPHVILSQYCTQKAAEAFMLFFFFVMLNMCFGWKNLHKFALNIIFTIMSSRGRRHHHRSMQYLHSIFAHVKWERKKNEREVCVYVREY